MRLIGLAVVLAVSLFAATLATEAQSAEKVYQIGWLSPASATTGASNFDALRNGLGELGYVEGRNIVFERRWADGAAARPPWPPSWSASRWT
jgi:putative ABC transport system substrate-binding protein